jgi:acetyl-CoA carboxylase beta subunit
MNKNKDEPLNIDSDESKQYLSNLRNTFIEFLLDDVMQDFKKEHQEITPENLINYYFTNKEDYENKLDQYEISTDHGDGIITDQNFSAVSGSSFESSFSAPCAPCTDFISIQ